jgi:hypothetical protein
LLTQGKVLPLGRPSSVKLRSQTVSEQLLVDGWQGDKEQGREEPLAIGLVSNDPAEGGVADGTVKGALLPLMRRNGKLFVSDNCLHFFPEPNAVSHRKVLP